jgi:hypothetical protein
VRYWLRVRFRFRRRQWPWLRPGFRWRRHWRGHRWRHWRRLDRLGPCRRRLRGFRLRCLTSDWSGLWCHLGGHFAVGHRGLTGTICRHPEMIPNRAFRPPCGGRPVSTSCALTCAALRAGPARSIHAGRTARWRAPDRAGVSIVSWTRVGLPGGVARRSARTATSGGRGRVIVSWMPCECTPALAAPRGARGTWWCPARRRAAWRPSTHHGTSRPTALRSRSRARRRPPCHAASWRPCISPTASKATRSRRSKWVAAPPELVSACFQRPESCLLPALGNCRIRAPGCAGKVRAGEVRGLGIRVAPRPCLRIRRPITTTAACTPGRVARPGVSAPGSFGDHCP